MLRSPRSIAARDSSSGRVDQSCCTCYCWYTTLSKATLPPIATALKNETTRIRARSAFACCAGRLAVFSPRRAEGISFGAGASHAGRGEPARATTSPIKQAAASRNLPRKQVGRMETALASALAPRQGQHKECEAVTGLLFSACAQSPMLRAGYSA